jgi:hypothetical protein
VLPLFDKLRGVNNLCNIVDKDFAVYETVIFLFCLMAYWTTTVWSFDHKGKNYGTFWDLATLLLLYGKKL